MEESKILELKNLNDRQTYIIITYCNAVGCRDCPLNRDPDDCESIELQGKIFDLEYEDYPQVTRD